MVAAKKTARDDDISGRPKIAKRLLEVFAEVEEGFINQGARSDDQMDWWEAYDCKLGEKQAYNGNAKLFVPIIHDAINARKTRFVNQVFPKSGRSVEVISANDVKDMPTGLIALAEHYVRKAKLRTKVAPALNRNGDIEGQYSVYVDWRKTTRHVAWREKEPLSISGVEHPGLEDIETVTEDVIFDEHPTVEVLSDADVLILPVTCDGVEEAIADGGSVTVIRRWGKNKLQQMIDDGHIDKDVGADLKREMSNAAKQDDKNPSKKHADAAGIKAKGKIILVYETWVLLKVDGEMRLCRSFYGGDKKLLGAKLNPYWCDRCPVISVPVEKVAGVAKGRSLVGPVAAVQYNANDIANQGADSATYSMLPIIMTDPLKNPRVGTMVLDLAAVWECDPNSTKFATFPQLWKDSLEIVQARTAEIFRTLNVNPSMIPQSSGRPGSKRNQAEMANEQAVDVLTTADAVGVQEEGVWTPIIERMMEYDAQFRDESITVRQFGQMGRRAMMERVEPIQMGKRWEFRWLGVEAARNAAQVQQKIALMNVARGIPPQMLGGLKVNIAPLFESIVEDMAGPRLAPLILEDERDQLSMDPEEENRMLEAGFFVNVHPGDDDVKHLQAHMMLLGDGDPMKVIEAHIMGHQQQMQAKAQAAEQAQQPKGQPGAPGGGRPGIAGAPRIGAQPAAQRPAQQPPGAIAPDRMGAAGAVTPPRRA